MMVLEIFLPGGKCVVATSCTSEGYLTDFPCLKTLLMPERLLLGIAVVIDLNHLLKVKMNSASQK
jgi:hypothetical protein